MYWYNQDIEWLEKKPVIKTDLKKIVFYGSSTFTLWDTLEQDFESFQTINLGFGGSTLAACAWFFERVVPKHQPDAIVIYAGDNDLGDGRCPEEVIIFYNELIRKIRTHLGNIPICFISIKLSPKRKHLKGSIEYTNFKIKESIENSNEECYFINIFDKMIDASGEIPEEFYKEDSLHLSEEGYKVVKEELSKTFLELF